RARARGQGRAARLEPFPRAARRRRSHRRDAPRTARPRPRREKSRRAPPDRRSHGSHGMKALVSRPWFGPLVALVCVYILFAALSPDTFARSINLLTMTRQTVVVAIAAVGMTIVMI